MTDQNKDDCRCRGEIAELELEVADLKARLQRLEEWGVLERIDLVLAERELGPL